MSQLERISKSISQYSNLVECIHHFYYTSWNWQVLYKVQINKSTKKEAAKAHNVAIEQFYRTSIIAIYIDASETQSEKEIEIKLVAYNLQNSSSKNSTTI